MRSLLYITLVLLIAFPAGPACSARQEGGLSLAFADDFSNPSSGWDTYTLPNGDSAACDKGGYITSINGANRTIWFKNKRAADIRSDFACEVSASNVSGTGDDSECGIIFGGKDNSNFYLFKVKSSNGTYSLMKLLNDQWIMIKDWTGSAYITGGAVPNKLKVACSSGSIEMYANGNLLDTVTGMPFDGGYIALELGTWQNPAAKYKFDDFMLFTGWTQYPASPSSTDINKIPPLFANSRILKTKDLALLWKDDFSDAGSGWQVSSSADGGSAYENGELAVWTKNPQKGQSAYSSAYTMTQDFAAEVEARQVAGDGNSTMGIFFRKSAGGDMYCFLIWGDRNYTCYKRLQGQQSFLMGTMPADALWADNKTNTLGIVCAGPQIELYANGSKLQSFTDNQTVTDPMNLQLVVTTNGSAETRYIFDNFKVYSVK
jgi:hypothetical protein